MTNRYDNWERLSKVICWAGMSVNYFATYIGMERSEALYQIKRGNFGISYELADLIVSRFPEIDRTWLITGIGNMLKSTPEVGTMIPYYADELERVLPIIYGLKPKCDMLIPCINSCDIAIRSMSRAMCDKNTATMLLLLKRVESNQIVAGNEYAIVSNNGDVMWRKIRAMRDKCRWRLVANNRTEFPDEYINKDDVKQAWRVIAKIALLVS